MKIDQAHAHFVESGAPFWHKGEIRAAMKMNKRALSNVPDNRRAMMGLELCLPDPDEDAVVE